MNSNLYSIINQQVVQLTKEIIHIPCKKIKFHEYVFRNTSIEDVTETGDGKLFGTVSFEIANKEIFAGTENEGKFDSAITYLSVVEKSMKSEKLMLIRKAIILKEFAQNLINNYSQEKIEPILTSIDKLYQAIDYYRQESGEETLSQFSTSKSLFKCDPKLKKYPVVRVVNLEQMVYCDKANFEKMAEMNKKGEKYRFSFLRRLIV